MKLGVSLSGGAAKGMVHLGVLQELRKNNISIDIISGCSIGALLAAMYAVNPNIDEMTDKLASFLENNEDQIIPINYVLNEEQEERRSLLNKIAGSLKMSVFYGISLSRISYLSSGKLKESLAKLIPDIDIQDCAIPFSCSATDISNYTDYYFTKGSLLDAVVTSCSLPGLYPPVKIDGATLIDGGWASPNMINQLRRMGADFVIASNVVQEVNSEEVVSGLDVVLRSDSVTRKILSEIQLKEADVVIQPALCSVNWWDFAASKDCMTLGMRETSAKISEINRKVRRRRLKIIAG